MSLFASLLFIAGSTGVSASSNMTKSLRGSATAAADGFDVQLFVKDGSWTNYKLMWDSSVGPWGTSFDDYNKLDTQSYPNRGGGTNWGEFSRLETMQFIIPEKWQDYAHNLYFKVTMPSNQRFRAYWGAKYLGEFNPLVDNQISLEDIIKNPKEPRSSQDPIHLDIFAIDDDGVKADVIWTVWVSFRHEWNENLEGHYCHLTQNVGDSGFQCCNSHGNCHVHSPKYKCFKADWSEDTKGDAATYLQFLGPLADDNIADGKPVNIHLDDDVEVGIPLTNQFVTHSLSPSNECNMVCKYLTGVDTHIKFSDYVDKCKIDSSTAMYKANLGHVRVSGYGRISGYNLQEGVSAYGGGKLWTDRRYCPSKDAVSTQEALHGCEWQIMGGLLTLAQSNKVDAVNGYSPIDIFEVAVVNSPKLNDGSILVNALYPLIEDGALSYDNAAKLYDVKTPGTWIDAADGPNLFGTSSQILFSYLQSADDTLKISASDGLYHQITLLHGSTGSAMLLGNFGLGLRNNQIQKAQVDGLAAHYLYMVGGADQQGSNTHIGILGSNTCLSEAAIKFSDVTIDRVSVPSLGFRHGQPLNPVNRIFALGTLDPTFTWEQDMEDKKIPGHDTFCKRTDTPHLQDVHLSIKMLGWEVHVKPDSDGLFFSNSENDKAEWRGYLVLDDVQFFDVGKCGWQNYPCMVETGVKIHDRDASGAEGDAFFVCATDQDTKNCMTTTDGAFWQAVGCQNGGACTYQDGNYCNSQDNKETNKCQNVDWFYVDVGGRLQFPYNDESNPW